MKSAHRDQDKDQSSDRYEGSEHRQGRRWMGPMYPKLCARVKHHVSRHGSPCSATTDAITMPHGDPGPWIRIIRNHLCLQRVSVLAGERKSGGIRGIVNSTTLSRGPVRFRSSGGSCTESLLPPWRKTRRPSHGSGFQHRARTHARRWLSCRSPARSRACVRRLCFS